MVEVGKKATVSVTPRDVTEPDLPIFFEHQLEPDATRMAAFPACNKEAFMTHWAKILHDRAVVKKTILLKGM